MIVVKIQTFWMLALLLTFVSLQTFAGTDSDQIPADDTIETDDPANAWYYSASSYIYMVPDDQNYASLIFTADRDWIHIEARYNYEDLDTGSAWIGYNFSFGKKLVLDATPMFGGVFGNLNGVAPGWEVSLSFEKLELYTENEYVFDLEDRFENFFYNWSQLTYSPFEWFQFGVVFQRTKVYQTELDIQRGLLVGFSYKMLDVTAYVFNLGWDKPTVSISAGLNF
jgi:hypothetical protein